jgi:hypothetical protein
MTLVTLVFLPFNQLTWLVAREDFIIEGLLRMQKLTVHYIGNTKRNYLADLYLNNADNNDFVFYIYGIITYNKIMQLIEYRCPLI